MPNADTRTATASWSPAEIAAFSELYQAHLPAIVRYLRRRLGDGPADDAASEVFIRAFRQGGAGGRAADPALPWLYGIAANVILEERRAERRRLRALDRLIRERPSHPVVAPTGTNLEPHLVRGLQRLSAADRETLLLVAWGELTYAETAQALGIPVGTVASRIARARRQLDDTGPVRSRGFMPTALRGDTNV